jgi:hypothetical protein
MFSADDFRPGGERVIMISDALWQERFGASPSVLGKTIRVSAATSGETSTEYRIISVLPPGVFGGIAVSRILQTQLHGVERFDPWTLAVTCIFLVTAGLFATWLPTRRVARSDPMTGLRAE